MPLFETLKTIQAEEFQSAESATDVLKQVESGDISPSEEIEAALPEKGIALGLHRLLARAYRAEGRDTDADHVLIQIAERLNQEEFWVPMVHVLEPMLERDAHRVAPLLLRARLQGGIPAVDNALLLRAHHVLPKHGVLAWEAAQALEKSGDSTGAVKACLQAGPGLLEDKNFDLLDEVILALLESPGAEVTRTFVHLLDKMTAFQEWDRFDALLDILKERFSTEEGAGIAWPRMRDWWLKHPQAEALRSSVVSILEPTLGAFPNPQAIIRVARINIPSENPSNCLDRLDRACLFPPGHYAEHSGWGLGLIRDNDIESVVVDFPSKPVHRMKMATAERALEPLSPEDLRVWQEHRLQELAAVAKQDPVGLVVMALRKMKDHTGTGDQIRKLLVPKPLATFGWSGWWKATKAKLAEDPRVDARRAFESIFRLSDGSEILDDLSLPSWNARQVPLKNLALLDTFLEQHSEARGAVLSEFQERVERILTLSKSTPEEKAASILWLIRMEVSGVDLPTSYIEAQFDFNQLPREYQMELVHYAATTPSLCAALGSRLQAVRLKAWETAEAKDLTASIWTEITSQVLTYPEATLFLFKYHIGSPSEALSMTLIKALIDLLENPPKATHRKRAMDFFEASSPVALALKDSPVSEDAMGPLTSRLKQWASSDKFRFPLLDFLKAVGHDHIYNVVMGHQARAHAKLAERSEGPSDPYDGDLVLSRISLDRLEAERTRIGMELKTTIPQSISTARDLGDLKENAEYHAAKEKQATYAARFQDLETQLQRVRLLENLERPEGVALPGTEIILESLIDSTDQVTYWLMGEGDQDFGHHVVSYRASLGKALHGHTVGDEIELPGVHEGKTYRITSVQEKLS